MKSIMYHYIRNKNFSFPYYNILKKKDFVQQIKKFSKIGFISSYRELFINSNKFLPTFDDGLKDHVYSAEILKRYDGIGIFFIPTAPLKNNTILEKYTQTSTNNKITLKSLGNNTNFFFDLEISLAGNTGSGGLYNWEVRMVDPANPANVLVLMDSASATYPQIQAEQFEGGTPPNPWGYGWKSETTPSSIDIKTNFFDAFGVTEAEVITTVSTNNFNDEYANVGAWLRVRSE